MSHPHAHVLPPAPGRLALPGIVQGLSAAAVLVGAAALAWAFGRGETQLAWSSYLIGVFFTLGLGVFGVAWLAILYLARGEWSVTMRRIPEAMSAWLVPGGILAMAVGFGAHSLYQWSHAEVVAQDELLLHKSPFLNLTMFGVLVGASLLLWVIFATLIVGTSRRQDREGGIGPTRTSRVLSAIFLVVFALTLSIVSFYLLLSLDAHWFSTMFAVLVFTDVVQTGTAFIAVVAGLLVMAGKLEGFLNENHLHSLGKMVFAWTGFWAYIYFCQFMLIWYANLPEETIYFVRRYDNGWLPYLLLLPWLKFVVPFVLMLPRDAKRNPRKLVPLAVLILFAQFWELFLMVGPAIGHGAEAAHAHLPLVEFAATIGFLGLFTLVFGWVLARHDAVPLKDPSLTACLEPTRRRAPDGVGVRALSQTIDLLGFLTLGLLGGFGHCVGMCSPFVLFVSRQHGAPGGGRRPALVAQCWYTAGRVVTYATLGALAGALGGVVQFAGALVGVQRAAAVVGGGVLVVWAVVALSDLVPRVDAGGRLFARVAAGLKGRVPGHPFTTGLFLGLLPCGLLYSAVVAAVARGGALEGAAALAVFGLGTAPALFGVSFADALFVRNRVLANRLSQLFVLAMGSWFLWRGLAG